MHKKVDAEKAILEVAMREGVTVEAVRQQMKLAMLAGLCSKDPQVQAAWGKIPCKDDVPTPEELITYFSACIGPEFDLTAP